MKKVRHWVQETMESGRFVETGAMSEDCAKIYAKHVDQAEIIDCSEHEIAYALIADIKEFDVNLPHELRKRMQAILDS